MNMADKKNYYTKEDYNYHYRLNLFYKDNKLFHYIQYLYMFLTYIFTNYC